MIELLVVVAVAALLLSILLPSLAAARDEARRVVCATRLHEIGRAFQMYAHEHRGRAMPYAYVEQTTTPTYWFGREHPDRFDATEGFLWPYLHAEIRGDGVFECPQQPPGTYEYEQGAAGGVTSTYGYNAYFLCPPRSSGWKYTIGRFPWQSIDTMPDAPRVFVFADTMLAWGDGLRNSALLDPPWLYGGLGRWTLNASPTTSFRHRRRTNAVHGDGHVAAYSADGDATLTAPERLIGSVGQFNDPHYVPVWREWNDR